MPTAHWYEFELGRNMSRSEPECLKRVDLPYRSVDLTQRELLSWLCSGDVLPNTSCNVSYQSQLVLGTCSLVMGWGGAAL